VLASDFPLSQASTFFYLERSKMPEIVVRSKLEAQKFECDKPWVAISIATNADDWPNLSSENRLDWLKLHFADTCDPKWCALAVQNGLDVFENAHARAILNFVGLHWDKIDVLLVHCEAGVSRSAGVAAAIAKIKTGNDFKFFEKPYVPNSKVYQSLLAEAFNRGEIGMSKLEKRLKELVRFGTILTYEIVNLDEDGNVGESDSRNSEKLTLTFPDGEDLSIVTFCSGCLENTCFDLG
jgi:predicted protein tyrosine phosphatase